MPKVTIPTYTKRTNARRAAVAAGIPTDQVEITVHKIGNNVRFGWRQQQPATGQQLASPPLPTATAPASESNGVKRPKAGGLCAAVWQWLDSNPTATRKEVVSAAEKQKWNLNNALCEYYQWRKFNGLSRSKAMQLKKE